MIPSTTPSPSAITPLPRASDLNDIIFNDLCIANDASPFFSLFTRASLYELILPSLSSRFNDIQPTRHWLTSTLNKSSRYPHGLYLLSACFPSTWNELPVLGHHLASYIACDSNSMLHHHSILGRYWKGKKKPLSMTRVQTSPADSMSICLAKLSAPSDGPISILGIYVKRAVFC